MKFSIIIAKGLIASLLSLVVIAGCVTGTQPKDNSASSEDPESPRGAGLFSGKDGKFTVFSSEKDKSEETENADTEKCDCESK